MPALQIRDLPDEIYNKIKELSEKEHRSLSSQALVLLKKALSHEESNQERRKKIIKEIESTQNKWSDDLPAPEDLIADDRAR